MKIKYAYLVLLLVVLTNLAGIYYYYSHSELNSDQLKLATTTSVDNTGLLDLLISKFTEQENVKVSVIAKGTGAAIDLARSGEVDAVIVHAPELELSFVNDGYGINRTTLWYNYFLLAGIVDGSSYTDFDNISQVFDDIANRGQNAELEFYSRGDNSGTHIKELSIWNTPPSGNWYKETGTGMAATLVTTSENAGYTLSDIGTYAQQKSEGNIDNLEIKYDNDALLYNPYSYIIVSPSKYEDLNSVNAELFLQFLQSNTAKNIVRNLVLGGIQLFNIIGE